MFYVLLYVTLSVYDHSSITIILMGKRELVALLYLSSWCLVVVGWLFLAVPWGCLEFVIVVLPDHTHLLFAASHDLTSPDLKENKIRKESPDESIPLVYMKMFNPIRQGDQAAPNRDGSECLKKDLRISQSIEDHIQSAVVAVHKL